MSSMSPNARQWVVALIASGIIVLIVSIVVLARR
jgi:hypothetical protein